MLISPICKAVTDNLESASSDTETMKKDGVGNKMRQCFTVKEYQSNNMKDLRQHRVIYPSHAKADLHIDGH